ncbi:RNA metabolism protein [Lithospermum erythrorhizon]|uniref:RNA metabolism protein n=1 Tax=Lithospermum erythrorhizon TaxID=34254 RepID=A0AAV3P533_LITER
MEGLLTIHKRMIDADADPANVTSGGTVCTRLLVAAAQAGSLIGKQGSTVKSIQDASNCNIRVLRGEHLPIFALPDDSVVEVQGESAGVHNAVELIVSHLRKFLVDRSIVGVFEAQMQKPNAPQNMPPSQHWGTPQGFPGAGGQPGYVPSPQYMHPPHPFDTYYPPGEIAPMDQPPHQGTFSHGRDHSMGAHVPNGQPHPSMVTKVTQNMQIPLSYADAVIGTAGSNISYIRRSSGATIAIQETRGVPEEMTIEITGSASQVQAAQQSIQTFITEAANNAQYTAGGPPGQGYNPYPSDVPSSYGSVAPNSTGLANNAPSGDYGSVYGSSYGY